MTKTLTFTWVIVENRCYRSYILQVYSGGPVLWVFMLLTLCFRGIERKLCFTYFTLLICLTCCSVYLYKKQTTDQDLILFLQTFATCTLLKLCTQLAAGSKLFQNKRFQGKHKHNRVSACTHMSVHTLTQLYTHTPTHLHTHTPCPSMFFQNRLQSAMFSPSIIH